MTALRPGTGCWLEVHCAGNACQAQSGQRELGLAEGTTLPAGLTTHELSRQRLLVILPPGATRPRLAVAEVGSVPFIAAPPGTSSRRLLGEALTGTRLSPRIAVVTAQREAILPLVLAGAGAALLPEPLAQVAARLGAVASDPRSIVLAHRTGLLAPAARRFLELATTPRAPNGLPAARSRVEGLTGDGAHLGSRCGSGHRSRMANAWARK